MDIENKHLSALDKVRMMKEEKLRKEQREEEQQKADKEKETAKAEELYAKAAEDLSTMKGRKEEILEELQGIKNRRGNIINSGHQAVEEANQEKEIKSLLHTKEGFSQMFSQEKEEWEEMRGRISGLKEELKSLENNIYEKEKEVDNFYAATPEGQRKLLEEENNELDKEISYLEEGDGTSKNALKEYKNIRYFNRTIEIYEEQIPDDIEKLGKKFEGLRNYMIDDFKLPEEASVDPNRYRDIESLDRYIAAIPGSFEEISFSIESFNSMLKVPLRDEAYEGLKENKEKIEKMLEENKRKLGDLSKKFIKIGKGKLEEENRRLKEEIAALENIMSSPAFTIDFSLGNQNMHDLFYRIDDSGGQKMYGQEFSINSLRDTLRPREMPEEAARVKEKLKNLINRKKDLEEKIAVFANKDKNK